MSDSKLVLEPYRNPPKAKATVSLWGKYRLLLEPAKGALILFSLSLVLALAMVVWPAHYQKARELALVQSELVLQRTRSEIETFSLDLDLLESHLVAFKHLASIGLVGDPERDLWVQKLEAIYESLDLPPPFRYALASPRIVDSPAVSAVGAAPALPSKALRHDLDIELSDIHDGEFLAFIDKLRTDWQVPFRIESCQMQRQGDMGMQIKCTLALFSLPVEKGIQEPED